jgi:hypothetical protein
MNFAEIGLEDDKNDSKNNNNNEELRQININNNDENTNINYNNSNNESPEKEEKYKDYKNKYMEDEFDPINYDDNVFYGYKEEQENINNSKNELVGSNNIHKTGSNNNSNEEEIDEEIFIEQDESYERSVSKKV